MLKFSITETNEGKRLDIFLSEKLPQLSRSFIQKLSKQEKILVNKLEAKPGQKLKNKDKVVVNYSEAELEQIPKIDLPIIYEDNDCIVINKPVGILSHSNGRFVTEPTVSSFIKSRVKDLEGERAGIVHRLDRATSGVMICAKSSEALIWLQKQFSTRKVAKSYTAIVKGHLSPKEAIIDMPIDRNPKAPSTFKVHSNGKNASTHYTVIDSSLNYDLVKLQPKTGRTHQLRVHLKHLGHPIVGDYLYGGETADRLYLHANSLDIVLPSNKAIHLETPLPIEFNKFLKNDHE